MSGKLVRDKLMMKIISSKGAFVKKLKGQEAENALWEKLYEEFSELVEAIGGDQSEISIREEAADCMEVLFGLAKFYGADPVDVADTLVSKYDERGGFEELWFVRIEDEEA